MGHVQRLLIFCFLVFSVPHLSAYVSTDQTSNYASTHYVPIQHTSNYASTDRLSSEIYLGNLDFKSQKLIHANGQCAWNGVRQGEHYSETSAFYHANGVIAWDGMKRTRNSWGDPSQYGIFYHDNGHIAWGGLKQKLNSWGDTHQEGVFYHRGGEKLWGGLNQKANIWGELRSDAIFYHANGQKAWEGLKKSKVYHSNGKPAWDCTQRGPVYDSNGNRIAVADYVYLHLGNNSWLYVNYLGEFKLTLYLGEGYQMFADKDTTSLEVLGMPFAL